MCADGPDQEESNRSGTERTEEERQFVGPPAYGGTMPYTYDGLSKSQT